MKRFTTLFVAATMAVVLAGCGGQQAATESGGDQGSADQGGSSETSTSSASSSDSMDDDSMMEETTSGTMASGSGAELPGGYPIPIPDDYQVVNVREGAANTDDAGDSDVQLQVDDPQGAYDYFTQTLQEEGFTIEETDLDDQAATFDADIDFQNADYDGNIDFSGQSVEIELDSNSSTGGSSGGAESGGSSSSSGSGETASTELPQGFPVTLPGGAEVQSVREGGDDPDDTEDVDVDFTVSDGQSAYDEFLQSLASDGFTVENDAEAGTDDGQFDGDIDFYNNEYEGSVSLEGTRGELDLGSRNQ